MRIEITLGHPGLTRRNTEQVTVFDECGYAHSEQFSGLLGGVDRPILSVFFVGFNHNSKV